MDVDYIGELLLIILGFILVVGAIITISTLQNEVETYTNLIEMCESSLPRNEHCKLEALPENK